MARRKTVPVEVIRDAANRVILSPRGLESAETQAAACRLVESVLLETDAYRGFGWVDADGRPLPTEEAATMRPDDPGYWQRHYA